MLFFRDGKITTFIQFYKQFYKKNASLLGKHSFSIYFFYKNEFSFSAIDALGATPTNLSTTSPFLKIKTVGIFLIP